MTTGIVVLSRGACVNHEDTKLRGRGSVGGNGRWSDDVVTRVTRENKVEMVA